MISLTQIELLRGGKPLLKEASATIHPGQKVALVGANGCGKSSLFALLKGELQPDSGELSLPAHWQLASVAQETPALACSALDYVLDGDQEYRALEQQLAQAEQADQGQRIAELHARLDTIGGYSIAARAAELLHGLGFSAAQQAQPVQAFSGGWRMRLNLAQALLCRSDLLLLDEPTNHLDLDAVIWLEKWLKQYPGTLLLISHDRDFIDQVVDRTLHIEQQRLHDYQGGYSAFERQRAEKLAQQQALYTKQQRQIAHMHSYIDRFRYKATKARQAQSRIKALERMEQLLPAHVDSQFQFSFRQPEALPHPLLSLDQVSAGYGDTAILRQVRLNLVPGSRIGLLGRNGAGKSTLIKLLAGQLTPLSGELAVNPGAKVGYFAQHQLETLRPTDSPLLHLTRLAPQQTEQALRDYLGGFGFHGDQALEPVEPFSGGEKARLVLALLVWQKPNLLLLDEPTNHLDLEMRHALTMALQSFEGAMVIVSHDRHLLRATTDEFYLVHDGSVAPFDGDLEDYHKWLGEQGRARQQADAPAPVAAGANSAVARKEQKRQQAEFRKQTQPLRKRLEKLERQVDSLSAEITAIEHELADPALYDSDQRDHLSRLLERQGQTRQALESAEQGWLELQEQLEQLEHAFSQGE